MERSSGDSRPAKAKQPQPFFLKASSQIGLTEQLQRWVSAGKQDEDVAHVLRVFSRGMDWHDLYHAFEVVLARMGSQIWKQGWASKADVDRFTQTANSRAALGIDARHGKPKVAAPKNPMTWDEADGLVRMTVWKWVNGLSRGPT